MQVNFAFGKTGLVLSLPEGPQYDIAEIRSAAALPDVEVALAAALDHPIGSRPLAELTAQEIERWRDTLLKQSLSGRSVALVLGILKQAMKHAANTKLLAYNVAEHVELPKQDHAAVPVWQVAEAQEFLAAVGADDLYAMWLLALTTGLRRAELAALQRSDLDLDHSQIRVTHAIQLAGDTGSKPSDGVPKRNSQRTVSIDAITKTALVEHCVRQSEEAKLLPHWQDTGHVFSTSHGTAYHPDALTHLFRKVADAAGSPNVHLHSLRHSAAALAIASGAGIKVVSARLGHSRTAITLDLYAYLLDGQDQAAATGVGTMLFPAKKTLESSPVTANSEASETSRPPAGHLDAVNRPT